MTTETLPVTQSAPPIKTEQHLLIERYRLEHILGQGSFGAAYLAEDTKLKRRCVIKQMLLPQGRSSQTMATYYSNFEKEAGLLVQLNHPGHPNIPEIYDYFTDDHGTYLVMKYIQGQSLKEILDKPNAKIPWEKAAGYIINVCDAVNYMHTTGHETIIHRDIKPANILLGFDDRIWLVDFGLAKANPVQHTDDANGTQASGSIGYSPLEQWLGQTVPASDVYAVGATLHHMVTGLHPAREFGDLFDFEKLHGMHGQFVPVRDVDRSLPQSLQEIIAIATDPNPENRPSALRLKEELQALLIGPKTDVLFTFKNGQIAKTVPELVTLCEQNLKEAQTYLQNGDFERWFKIINRNDLAQAAVEALNTTKTVKDALKKFLKLIMPNLFWRKVGKFVWKTIKLLVSAAVVLVIAGAVGIMAVTYGAKVALAQGIGTYPWEFSAVNFETPAHLTETMVNEELLILQSDEPELSLPIRIDFHFPDRIEFKQNDTRIFRAIIALEDGIPHIYLTGLEQEFMGWVGWNLSQGINQGIRRAFNRADVTATYLLVQDDFIEFELKKKSP